MVLGHYFTYFGGPGKSASEPCTQSTTGIRKPRNPSTPDSIHHMERLKTLGLVPPETSQPQDRSWRITQTNTTRRSRAALRLCDRSKLQVPVSEIPHALWSSAWCRGCTRARACVCVSACIHIHIYIYVYICVYIYIHTYTHTCMHACMHACRHTYIYTYVHIYISV